MVGLTPGCIYFIEAIDVGEGDANWIVAGAGDPDTIDISEWTEGTDYCYFPIPLDWRIQFHTGIIVTDSGGGGMSYSERTERKGYTAFSRGFHTSIANAMHLSNFFMSHRHTSAASATYKPVYMIIYIDTNVHWPFRDHNDDIKSYCLGAALLGSASWIDTQSLRCMLSINFRSVWQ